MCAVHVGGPSPQPEDPNQRKLFDNSKKPEDPNQKLSSDNSVEDTPPGGAPAAEPPVSQFAGALGLVPERTLYHPGGHGDFAPLIHLTHLVDTFVCCDLVVRPQRLVELLLDLPGALIEVVDTKEVDMGGFDSYGETRDDVPWCREVHLVRKIGPIRRQIRLVYIGGEACTVYEHLFSQRKLSPRILCPKGSSGDGSLRMSSTLGEMLRRNPDGLPGLVVTDTGRSRDSLLRRRDARNGQATITDNGRSLQYGPYRRLWQIIGMWRDGGGGCGSGDAVVLARDDWRPPAQDMDDGKGAVRRVDVIPRLLGPDSMIPADGVLATRGFLGSHHSRRGNERAHWLQHKELFDGLDVAISRLPDLLSAVEERCQEAGIRHVACFPVGGEDEYEYLRLWRRRPGLPERLTIYAPDEGDVYALRPHVDRVIPHAECGGVE